MLLQVLSGSKKIVKNPNPNPAPFHSTIFLTPIPLLVLIFWFLFQEWLFFKKTDRLLLLVYDQLLFCFWETTLSATPNPVPVQYKILTSDSIRFLLKLANSWLSRLLYSGSFSPLPRTKLLLTVVGLFSPRDGNGAAYTWPLRLFYSPCSAAW